MSKDLISNFVLRGDNRGLASSSAESGTAFSSDKRVRGLLGDLEYACYRGKKSSQQREGYLYRLGGDYERRGDVSRAIGIYDFLAEHGQEARYVDRAKSRREFLSSGGGIEGFGRELLRHMVAPEGWVAMGAAQSVSSVLGACGMWRGSQVGSWLLRKAGSTGLRFGVGAMKWGGEVLGYTAAWRGASAVWGVSPEGSFWEEVIRNGLMFGGSHWMGAMGRRATSVLGLEGRALKVGERSLSRTIHELSGVSGLMLGSELSSLYEGVGLDWRRNLLESLVMHGQGRLVGPWIPSWAKRLSGVERLLSGRLPHVSGEWGRGLFEAPVAWRAPSFAMATSAGMGSPMPDSGWRSLTTPHPQGRATVDPKEVTRGRSTRVLEERTSFQDKAARKAARQGSKADFDSLVSGLHQTRFAQLFGLLHLSKSKNDKTAQSAKRFLESWMADEAPVHEAQQQRFDRALRGDLKACEEFFAHWDRFSSREYLMIYQLAATKAGPVSQRAQQHMRQFLSGNGGQESVERLRLAHSGDGVALKQFLDEVSSSRRREIWTWYYLSGSRGSEIRDFARERLVKLDLPLLEATSTGGLTSFGSALERHKSPDRRQSSLEKTIVGDRDKGRGPSRRAMVPETVTLRDLDVLESLVAASAQSKAVLAATPETPSPPSALTSGGSGVSRGKAASHADASPGVIRGGGDVGAPAVVVAPTHSPSAAEHPGLVRWEKTPPPISTTTSRGEHSPAPVPVGARPPKRATSPRTSSSSSPMGPIRSGDDLLENPRAVSRDGYRGPSSFTQPGGRILLDVSEVQQSFANDHALVEFLRKQRSGNGETGEAVDFNHFEGSVLLVLTPHDQKGKISACRVLLPDELPPAVSLWGREGFHSDYKLLELKRSSGEWSLQRWRGALGMELSLSWIEQRHGVEKYSILMSLLLNQEYADTRIMRTYSANEMEAFFDSTTRSGGWDSILDIVRRIAPHNLPSEADGFYVGRPGGNTKFRPRLFFTEPPKPRGWRIFRNSDGAWAWSQYTTTRHPTKKGQPPTAEIEPLSVPPIDLLLDPSPHVKIDPSVAIARSDLDTFRLPGRKGDPVLAPNEFFRGSPVSTTDEIFACLRGDLGITRLLQAGRMGQHGPVNSIGQDLYLVVGMQDSDGRRPYRVCLFGELQEFFPGGAVDPKFSVLSVLRWRREMGEWRMVETAGQSRLGVDIAQVRLEQSYGIPRNSVLGNLILSSVIRTRSREAKQRFHSLPSDIERFVQDTQQGQKWKDIFTQMVGAYPHFEWLLSSREAYLHYFVTPGNSGKASFVISDSGIPMGSRGWCVFREANGAWQVESYSNFYHPKPMKRQMWLEEQAKWAESSAALQQVEKAYLEVKNYLKDCLDQGRALDFAGTGTVVAYLTEHLGPKSSLTMERQVALARLLRDITRRSPREPGERWSHFQENVKLVLLKYGPKHDHPAIRRIAESVQKK